MHWPPGPASAQARKTSTWRHIGNRHPSPAVSDGGTNPQGAHQGLVSPFAGMRYSRGCHFPSLPESQGILPSGRTEVAGTLRELQMICCG